MKHRRRDVQRYDAIRSFMARKWPDVFTQPNSGLDKKPLRVNIKQAILQRYPEYTREDIPLSGNLRVALVFDEQRNIMRDENGERLTRVVMMHPGKGDRTFEDDLNYFLMVYCQGLRYWSACTTVGALRTDIDGQVNDRLLNALPENVRRVFTVTEGDAQYATRRLGEALARQENRERLIKMLAKNNQQEQA